MILGLTECAFVHRKKRNGFPHRGYLPEINPFISKFISNRIFSHFYLNRNKLPELQLIHHVC